ncbi:dihydroneopterin aldolase [Halomonas piscis]|uniref:7,8-dihydroneopterin aldolase n=1 Tax=Halomonas piscis TaxID=3031727 RepID=A0ABY9Z2R5_9GAMM|nr:dihydroneopterin aldolase [Halomonas piscis]WNK20905.1 dihydroneopterin aldolase [Halomonas piscis]
MTDRIIIEALEVETVIGAYDWERTLQQRLSLDLELATDIRPAAATDDLALALDYAALCERIQAFAAEHQFELVETFAERLVATLREEFGITGVTLTLRKPGAVPAAASVGLKITRGRFAAPAPEDSGT